MDVPDSPLFFNDSWNLYFHDPDNSQWDIQSYILLTTLTHAEEWIQIHQLLKPHWNKGMFFLMREHIQPVWEDENHREGGCISFKLWKNDVAESWMELVSKTLGETLLKDTMDWNSISGISISPKRSYCIARIWIRDPHHSDMELYNYTIPSYARTMYKSHVENIEQDGS